MFWGSKSKKKYYNTKYEMKKAKNCKGLLRPLQCANTVSKYPLQILHLVQYLFLSV